MDLDVCSSSLDCRVDFNCDTSATGEALSELENVIHSEHKAEQDQLCLREDATQHAWNLLVSFIFCLEIFLMVLFRPLLFSAYVLVTTF